MPWLGTDLRRPFGDAHRMRAAIFEVKLHDLFHETGPLIWISDRLGEACVECQAAADATDRRSDSAQIQTLLGRLGR